LALDLADVVTRMAVRDPTVSSFDLRRQEWFRSA
jgi:hypothetical protein